MAGSGLDPAFSFICSNVLKIGKFHIKKTEFKVSFEKSDQ